MNALKKTPASVSLNGDPRPSAHSLGEPPQFSIERIKELVAELEVPFPVALVEWRVTNMTEDKSRGQILPYADPRAYTDRLNELLTPAGWTRKYAVTTSPNFERSDDHKLVAKVFVTCDTTIHGIGSHSATGEDWIDNDNAGTSAEAQAFKRACSCFGLGRYFYSIGGVWVDLDERERPLEIPQLQGWATPEGWREGMRPGPREDTESRPALQKQQFSSKKLALIQQVEAMSEPLGKALYRGLLKQVARVWSPADIRESASLRKVLAAMQSAEQSLGRFEAARQKIGPEALEQILSSLKLRSVAQIDNPNVLQQLLSAVEEKASQLESA